MNKNESRYEHWLSFAEEDLNSAKALLEVGIYNQVCFHAQQVVEKSLKAFLKNKGINLPKTHNLFELIELCVKESKKFSQVKTDCQYLSRFYLSTRYPDAFVGSLLEGLPDEDDAKKAINRAGEVFKFVKELLLKD